MKKFLALLLAVAMTLALVACGGNSTNNANSGDAESTGSEGGDTIKIALIANTTGDYAQYGIPVRNGAMLYIDQLNANGGINGKQVEVLEYDDKGDGVEAVNAFNLAMDQGITAVIGSVLTGPTITLADATYEVNMPQISASATAQGVTQIDPEDESAGIRTNVFRSCFIDPFQGQTMAHYASEKLGATTAAILYESGSDYSEGCMNGFVEACGELGIEVVATEAFATGDKDFNAQMTKIAAANPDVVFMPFYYSEAGLAITQGRQAGLTATILGADGFGGIKDYASAEYLEGTVYGSGYAPGTESVAQFEQDYLDTYGESVPNMFAPQAYDAAMLLCLGIQAAEDAGLTAGTDEYKQAIIGAIAAVDGVQGITGTYSFDANNNPEKSVAMIGLQGGEEVFTEFYSFK